MAAAWRCKVARTKAPASRCDCRPGVAKGSLTRPPRSPRCRRARRARSGPALRIFNEASCHRIARSAMNGRSRAAAEHDQEGFGMNRRHALAVYLAEAEAQVERSKLLVMKQRSKIRHLGLEQRDTTSAVVVLGYLERQLSQHTADRDR